MTCLWAGVGGTASAAEPRYLYVLDCSAGLQKLDLKMGRTIASTDLTQRSKQVPTHGDAANSVPDGCATYGAAYSAEKRLLYTVAPVTGSMHGTPRRYRVLSFRVPGLHAGPVIELQETYGDDEAPTLALDAGAITLSGNGRTWRLVGSRFVVEPVEVPEPAGRPPSRIGSLHPLDPSRDRSSGEEVAARGDGVATTPLERAGAVVLVQFFSAERGVAYATVDVGKQKFTPLNIPFRTTDERVHLAPGGKAVAVQEASHGAAGLSITTDRMAVLHAASGEVVKAWTEASIAGWYLLTVTPKGQLVFYRGGETRLVSNAVEPRAGEVAVLPHGIGPAFFYADR